ncbi:MAG: DUF4838 domain-containing protein [Victivallales bacterium]
MINGKTAYGIEFGVYEFLERYLGIRWLFPGELGEYIPAITELSIQRADIRQNPSFLRRQLMIDNNGRHENMQPLWEAWAAKLKKRRWRDTEIYPAHNIGYVLLPPMKYVHSHPEFFPIRNGKRFLPSPEPFKGTRYYKFQWQAMKWQPCFSQEATITEAAENICQYFARRPNRNWCSLGVNDMGGYCECAKCMAQVGGKKNFLDIYNYSDLYYAWANHLVKNVLKRYPGKTFQLIAYSEIAEPPRFKLNPRITPFLAYERLKWADPAIRRHGKTLTRQWAQKAASLGWYDYIYGEPYKLPRVWFHLMADYYRFGYSQNVRSYIAEAALNADWREGPKIYVCLKLLWNVNQDVDKLLNEWYEYAVGKKAAPCLAAYFRIWENYWTVRVLETKWFKRDRNGEGGQYLPFYRDGYLSALKKQDFDNSERLLVKAVKNADTSRRKARAELFLKTYRGWSAPLVRALGEYELQKRYVQLAEFKNRYLGAALDSFSEFLNSYGNNVEVLPALSLMTALLEEKAGRRGKWSKALKKSPWFKSRYGWFKDFCLAVGPEAMGKDNFVIGRINKASAGRAWLKENKVTDFRSYQDNSPVSQPTIVACAYDEKNLYVTYVCFETEIGELKTLVEKGGAGKVWDDDCIEFFIDPAGKGADFYQIAVNAAGARFERHGKAGIEWKPEYKARTFKGDTFWTAELVLPFSAFGIKDFARFPAVKINFNRHRPATANRNREISGWQFTDGSNLNAKNFSKVIFK